MRYVSTRGGSPKCSLLAASLLNLPNDGGLFVPQTIPKVTPVQLKRFRSLGFQDLAFEILRLFITETDVPKEKLRTILRKCYKGFDESDVVVPLVVLDEDDDTDDLIEDVSDLGEEEDMLDVIDNDAEKPDEVNNWSIMLAFQNKNLG